ncbi:spore coat protein [Bacillus wiedmannii]|uniref:Spore coat protein n=1 Tax=Bacillus wiedmannii TaxID=1890302 RepID=A0A2A7W3N8_9BACI|nr:spore coat protein [Bacillus wiedmannii]OUB50436.1 spore coat protein [Bacillus thuringiensis serovar argentinensis]MED3122740.1 spore coat protein [Bacillus wiedmannii]OTX88200.1 spore coat protein [Bacillus wiedmannii]PEJ09830.1 spore coat protein [Bacillus wiedmannii]PHC70583.1 spore coat protein [Bacillus wiedmannii]
MSLFHWDFLKDLIGSYVRVNRGGPESQKGTIVSLGVDYFGLENEKGENHYYQLRHLKSITQNTKDGGVGDFEWVEEDIAEDFETLLQSFKYRWVKINRGGPEKIEGILQDVSGGYVTLIIKEEVVLIALSHIKSVNYNAPVSGESDESSDESSNEKSNENSNNSSRARALRQSSRGR